MYDGVHRILKAGDTMKAGRAVIAAAVLAAPMMVEAASFDRAGRPIDEADGKVYYTPDPHAAAIRSTSRVFAPRTQRAPSVPYNVVPPVGFPVFSGNGQDFGFYDFVSYPVGSWPDAVAIADVDGDGRNDVILATTFYFDTDNDYHVFVFIQDTDGSLKPPVKYLYTDHTNTVGLATIRSPGASGSDVIVGTGSGIERFSSTPSGLAAAVFYSARQSDVIAPIDVDLDGHTDIAALSWSNSATIYHNDGTAAFSTTTTLTTNDAGYDSMRARDIDGDGLTDLLIAAGQGSPAVGINVHWQTGNASIPGSGALSTPTTFGPPPGESMLYADAGDINSDGKADIVASRARNSPTWLWQFDGQGGHSFAAGQDLPSYDIPETVVVADINGDGKPDIVTLHGGWNKAGLYLRDTSGVVRAEQLSAIPYASHYSATGLAIGDINGDGCADAVIADYNNGLVILYGHDCKPDDIFKSDFE
jgi:hypothetical protein